VTNFQRALKQLHVVEFSFDFICGVVHDHVILMCFFVLHNNPLRVSFLLCLIFFEINDAVITIFEATRFDTAVAGEFWRVKFAKVKYTPENGIVTALCWARPKKLHHFIGFEC